MIVHPVGRPNHAAQLPVDVYACGDCRHLVRPNAKDVVCRVHGRTCTHCAWKHEACVARVARAVVV